LVTFVQMIAFGVVGFGIIILTAKSIFATLNKPAVGLALPGGVTGELPGGGGVGPLPGSAALGIGGPEGALAVEDDDDTVTLSQIQGQMRASSIRKVVQLVDRHPDTTLGIIRGWISTDHG
jgi:flagellar M-ring protein FliF